MGDGMSELVRGVLAEAERIGFAPGSIRYCRSCCQAVIRFCGSRGIDRLTSRTVDTRGPGLLFLLIGLSSRTAIKEGLDMIGTS